MLVTAPGWLTETVLDQGQLGEDAWLRAAGVMAIALAAQMVLVGHRIEELWWWSWTFVVLQIATTLVFVANALLGVPDGAAAWPWWLLAALDASAGIVLLGALARAGTERSPA